MPVYNGGDGKWIVDEGTCDDNNVNDGDGCSSTCQQETGWTCTAISAGVSTCVTTCGDGVFVEGYE